MKEGLKINPFMIVFKNEAQYLCVKKSNGKNTYFFTTEITNLPNGVSQSALPSYFAVDTSNGFPKVVKKISVF